MRSGPPTSPGAIHDRPRLGELLVRAGCITAAQLEGALREQSSWGGRVGQNLVDQGVIDERTLAFAIARQLYLKVVNLDDSPPPHEVVRLVPVGLAERYGLIAVAVSRERGRILVACADPTSNDAMREVRRVTGLVPEVCVATASQIDRAVRRHYYAEADPAPSPDPQLDVTRRSIVEREGPDRLEGLEKRLDTLLDLVRTERGDR